MFVAIFSIVMGLLAYLLSFNKWLKKNLYRISVWISILFYTEYLYYYFLSSMNYLYINISQFLLTDYFIIGVFLLIMLNYNVLLQQITDAEYRLFFYLNVYQ